MSLLSGPFAVLPVVTAVLLLAVLQGQGLAPEPARRSHPALRALAGVMVVWAVAVCLLRFVVGI